MSESNRPNRRLRDSGPGWTRWCPGLLVLFGLAGFGTVGHAVTPGADELAEKRRWVAAKLEGIPEPRAQEPGLWVIANHDPVQKNARAGRPLKLGRTEFARGLYCHAPSRIVVRLPEAGVALSAVCGIDSNEQTSGGRGSVEFSVKVGGTEAFRSGVVREGMEGKPIRVDLGGATEFELQIAETPDGISCDQADWAEAKVTLSSGRELWLAELPLHEGPGRSPFTTDMPFSFRYDGKALADLGWKPSRIQRRLDEQRTEHTLLIADTKPGLQVRCVAVEYHDFPTVEWTLYFKNMGASNTTVLSEILALDDEFQRGNPGLLTLHHFTGSPCLPTDFQPLETSLLPGVVKRITAAGGRPSNSDLPYFNVAGPRDGVIVAVGWPGQWAARFAMDASKGLRVSAGQEKTHLVLHPGEEIRTPLMVLQFWRGDWIRAQNIWRRWMLAHSMPRPGGRLPPVQMAACSSHQFGEMIHANTANQMRFVDRYLEEKLPLDYWWMDAGWYPCDGSWPKTGTWEVDTNRFPGGLRTISDHARGKGVKTIVWFEPERVHGGTWLATTHPEWVLGGTNGGLLNLGNAPARHWLTEHIDQLITSQGVDLYRQDFNMDPLSLWQKHDAEDRQGITENHHVTGYLAYWDELRRRHPDMLIDSCASGGRRNDLETMRRAVPLLRSDYIMEPVGNQGHTYGLSFWLPFQGTGTGSGALSPYLLRSTLVTSFTACFDVRRTDLDYDLIRRVLGQWRRYADCYFGDYYPLTGYSLDAGLWMAWQFDVPEKGQGMVQAFRRDASPYESAKFVLRGLDPQARYTFTDIDTGESRVLTGEEVLGKGLAVTVSERPGSAVIVYAKVE